MILEFLKEYFPIILFLIILLGQAFVLFLIINFFKTFYNYIKSSISEDSEFLKIKIPVYLWMWGIGILFFFLTFIEAYLWLVPFFRENIVRDIMVQWKSYGSLILKYFSLKLFIYSRVYSSSTIIIGTYLSFVAPISLTSEL